MGTFRITVEIGDQTGQRFQELEALVDTGATFTKVPRSILEALDIPPARTYTALLADGRRVPGNRDGQPSGWKANSSPRRSPSAKRGSQPSSAPWPSNTPCWPWTRTGSSLYR